MTFISWNKKYSVGIERIDGQHQKLFKILNKLYDHLNKGEKSNISSILNDLLDYTIFHFSTEERFMKKYDCPHLQSHQEQHKIFINEVKKKKRKYKAGSDISKEILQYLKDWTCHHILTEDLRMGSFFKEKGISYDED